MEPVPTALDADLKEILALLKYLGPDDHVRKAILPMLRLHTQNKEATALPFLGRALRRTPKSAGLVAALCLVLPNLFSILAL